MIVQNLIEPIGNVPNPLKYEEVVEINFEQGLLRGEMNHSSKVSILRSILDEMWSKITDDPNELQINCLSGYLHLHNYPSKNRKNSGDILMNKTDLSGLL